MTEVLEQQQQQQQQHKRYSSLTLDTDKQALHWKQPQHRRCSSQPPLKIEAARMMKHKRYSSNPPKIVAAAWMEEQAVISPKNSTLTLQGIYPQSETLDAAKILLSQAKKENSRLDDTYKDFIGTAGSSLDQDLQDLLYHYLFHYGLVLEFTDCQDPHALVRELNDSLGKLRVQKTNSERLVEVYEKQYLAQLEVIRKLTLEASQIERSILEEFDADDDNNSSWLYPALATFSFAAILYAFKCLSRSFGTF